MKMQNELSVPGEASCKGTLAEEEKAIEDFHQCQVALFNTAVLQAEAIVRRKDRPQSSNCLTCLLVMAEMEWAKSIFTCEQNSSL